MLCPILQTFRKLKSGKGSSTLEVTIIYAAVIGVLIVFITRGGPFQKALFDALASVTYGIEEMRQKIPLGYNGSTTAVAYSTWYGESGGWEDASEQLGGVGGVLNSVNGGGPLSPSP